MTTLQEIYYISQIIAVLGIFGSLIVLICELHRNTKALRANASWNSEIIYANANIDIARDPEFVEMYNRACALNAKPSDFTEVEKAQINFAVRSSLRHTQAQWWLWKSGSLPNELWEIRCRWAKSFVKAPMINAIWKTDIEQHIFSDQFVSDIQATGQAD